MGDERERSAIRKCRGTPLALFVRRIGNEVCRSANQRIFLPHTSPYTGSRGPARGPGCRVRRSRLRSSPRPPQARWIFPFPILHPFERQARGFVTARDAQSANFSLNERTGGEKPDAGGQMPETGRRLVWRVSCPPRQQAFSSTPASGVWPPASGLHLRDFPIPPDRLVDGFGDPGGAGAREMDTLILAHLDEFTVRAG